MLPIKKRIIKDLQSYLNKGAFKNVYNAITEHRWQWWSSYCLLESDLLIWDFYLQICACVQTDLQKSITNSCTSALPANKSPILGCVSTVSPSLFDVKSNC